MALTNATLPYAALIAGKGWKEAARSTRGIKEGINIVNGIVTCDGVAVAFGMEYCPIDDILKGE